ncbi:MAG: OmpA family protein [Gemmatimonadota bacterium]|nr:OmpA family protein [Gemmatimonadota bacterium]
MIARRLIVFVALVTGAVACSSAGSPPQLAQAKQMYATLEQQGAERRAEGPMIRAKKAITDADNAEAEGRAAEFISGLAQIAWRTTQEADAENARVLLSASADSLRSIRDRRLISLTQAQRDALAAQNQLSQAENAALRDKNAAVTTALSAEQMRSDSLKAVADSANARLNAALNQLRSLVVEITNLQQTSRGLVVSLSDVLFDVDKANLKSGSEAKIRQIAAVLQQYPNNQISVEGHTDATGGDAYNQKLSEDRAASVRASLVAGGIDASHIKSSGYGKTQPVATNATPEGRQRNRRVEIVVLGAGTVADAAKADSAVRRDTTKPPQF